MYKNFEELLSRIQNNDSPKKLAIISAGGEHTIKAVTEAYNNKIIQPIFIGNKNKVIDVLKKLNLSPNNFSIIHVLDENECLNETIKLIHSGYVDIVMKDQIQTADLMRAFLNKDNNLLSSKVVSHITFNKVPYYHKIIAITDTSINIYPDLESKKHIIINAVNTMMSMGFQTPKVAVLAAVEYFHSKMSETIDALSLKELNIKGEIKNCIIEGPISYDLAIDRESAAIKGFNSAVAGDADLLVVPNLVSGNLLGKALNYTPESEFAGFVIGTKVPIVLTSRSSTTRNKYLSIALAASIEKDLIK